MDSVSKLFKGVINFSPNTANLLDVTELWSLKSPLNWELTQIGLASCAKIHRPLIVPRQKYCCRVILQYILLPESMELLSGAEHE